MTYHVDMNRNNERCHDMLRKKSLLGITNVSMHVNCNTCIKCLHSQSMLKSEHDSLASKPLELVHLDLFTSRKVTNVRGKQYMLVLVDEYSYYAYFMMANQKSDLVELFADVCSSIHRLYNQEIQEIRSDFPQNLQGTGIPSFCKSQGIKNNFVKSYRKPLLITKSILKTVHEMANLMLVEKDLQMEFWADAVQTACHLINRVYLKPFTTMTPAEIWYDRKPNLHYLRVFGSKCRIPETTDDEGIFIGYSAKGKTYRIFNPKTKEVIESAKIDVDR